MRLPKKITPCPIVEAIVEIRFDSEMEPDAIFGIMYKEFKDEYPTTKKLPILQFPEAIRLHTLELKYNPYYQMICDGFILQIGPKVISLANNSNYIGWEMFFPRIIKVFSGIQTLDIIQSVERLGIRYINFFESLNIFDRLNLQIKMNDELLTSTQSVLNTVVTGPTFTHRLQIASAAAVKIGAENQTEKKGSIIDIDMYIENKLDNFFSEMSTLIQQGHEEEKKVFFGLLKPEFLNQHNPEYSESV